ncbi:hypothetical protein [Rubritalea marina]|uniref:hypothetical protein n=1 Tax=Rubritalea marina TaxID=361055 RepID=UPI00035F7A29|nr:hypothetical protein [Rubritalea marina]
MRTFLKKNTRDSQAGFALIATISVMALLVMVALGVMSLSTSQIRSSENFKLQMEARSNARLGLMVALGELQKAAGPDQRITAPASIRGKNVDQPQLVGVWKSFAQDNSDNSGISYDSQKRNDFIQWLSSSADDDNLDYNYPEQSPQDSVVLLGDGTLTETAGDPMSQSVRAAKVPVSDQSGSLTEGSYAWHVFDESLKANIQLNDPQPQNTADRVAAITGTGKPDFETLSKSNVDYKALEDLTDEEKEKLHSFGSSALVGSNFQPKTANAFNTLTVDSKNLLIDVVNGGYQKDLSLLFENTSLPSDYDNRYLYSESNSPLVNAPARFDGAEMIPSPDPKWALLHSHYKMYDKVTGSSSGYAADASILARDNPAFFDSQQLLPVISNAQFIFSLSAQDFALTPPYNTFLGFWVDMAVTLWNPYDVAIRIDGLELEMYRFPLQVEFFRKETSNAPWQSVTSNTPVHTAFMFNGGNNSTGVDNVQDALPYRARIPGSSSAAGTNDIILKPGEYRVFGAPVADPQYPGPPYTYNHQNWNYSRGLVLAEGYDPLVGGIFDRFIASSKDQTPLSPLPTVPGAFIFQIWGKTGDTFGVGVSPAKVERTTSFWPETNNRELVTYMKIFRGDGGNHGTVTNVDSYEDSLNQNRTQIGAVEIDMESNKMEDMLPSWGPDELSTFYVTDANRTTQGVANFPQYKQPFLIASVRLKTERDSYDIDGSPTASQWLHNGITNTYFTNGITDGSNDPTDQNENESSHQYEITWEKMTSWNNIPAVEIDSDNRGYGGTGVSSESGVNVVAFAQVPLSSATSIAQFVHAPLNAGGQAPLTTQIVGNSFSSPLIPLNSKSKAGSIGRHLDHSYMANTALFDSYFLSSAATESGPLYDGSGRDVSKVVSDFFDGVQYLRNRNIVAKKGANAQVSESDYETFAQYLYNHGAFNVNSTSVDAWALFLASGVDDALPFIELLNGTGAITSTGNTSNSVFSRYVPLLGEVVDANESGPNRWAGHRQLSAQQIYSLAELIVQEVELRGPFQSIAEFVNRRLESDSATADAGAIQSAIDKADINTPFGDPAPKNAAELGDSAGTANTSDGAPTQLTQADILTRISPSITVRGDTFKIRSYGEASDGKSTARAWCEAVVQRDHEFSDASQQPTTSLDNLNVTNQELGRRFNILSFRWLSESEL